LGSLARNRNSEVIPGRSDHAVSSCLSTVHQESREKGWQCHCSCCRIQSVLVAPLLRQQNGFPASCYKLLNNNRLSDHIMLRGFAGLWRHADFMRLWAGQTISGFGSLIGATAIGFTATLVLHATPFQLGILAAVRLAPGFLTGVDCWGVGRSTATSSDPYRCRHRAGSVTGHDSTRGNPATPAHRAALHRYFRRRHLLDLFRHCL
jgi:hypothetical protein